MAKRISLREFQQDLTRRLQEVGSSGRRSALLAVVAGSENWLIDLTDAGEIIAINALTEVPLTRNWFRGLANVRGNLYSVVDLAAFHGLAPTPRGALARLLLVGTRHGMNSALLVDRILGLRAPEGLKPEPAAVDPARPWAGEHLRDARGDTWRRLRVPALLEAPRFLEVAL